MHVFIAGIMQGSREDHLIDDQDYRRRITDALLAHVPGVRITDPYALNSDSVNYDFETARQTFVTNTALAAEADVLIAYLPTASMGTAVEMWTAYRAKRHIVAVTPMEHNWVVKVTSSQVLPDLETLIQCIESGEFSGLLTRDRG